jgi:hypothetical protein
MVMGRDMNSFASKSGDAPVRRRLDGAQTALYFIQCPRER